MFLCICGVMATIPLNICAYKFESNYYKFEYMCIYDNVINSKCKKILKYLYIIIEFIL